MADLEQRKKILFVVAEPQNLWGQEKPFAAALQCQCHFAFTAEQALQMLAQQDFALFVSDYNLPRQNQNGRQLLQEVKLLYPATFRILLTEYVHENEQLSALREGSAQLCLAKPCSEERMLSVLKRLLASMEIMHSREILAAIAQMHALPTISGVYSRVCTIIDQDGGMEKVVTAIAKDQSIAAKVLQVINSSFYAVKTGSLKQAAVLLGYINIRSIVLVASVFNFPPQEPVIAKVYHRLWQHSSVANQLLQSLHLAIYKRKASEFSATAGLLHDIGRVVFLMAQANEYRSLMQVNHASDSEQLSELERKLFGVAHDELGGYLLNWWGFPYCLAEAALYHHKPLDARVLEREITCLTHLAHWYSWRLLSPKDKIIKQELDTDVFSYLGVSKEYCDNIVAQLHLLV